MHGRIPDGGADPDDGASVTQGDRYSRRAQISVGAVRYLSEQQFQKLVLPPVQTFLGSVPQRLGAGTSVPAAVAGSNATPIGAAWAGLAPALGPILQRTL